MIEIDPLTPESVPVGDALVQSLSKGEIEMTDQPETVETKSDTIRIWQECRQCSGTGECMITGHGDCIYCRGRGGWYENVEKKK